MKVINVVGGNLFKLAADHLHDATLWDKIAKLNGLDDPVITGVKAVLLPDVTLAAKQGVRRA